MFPAGAGMNQCRSFGTILRIYVPRRRGDEPVSPNARLPDATCSPQARG